MTGDRPIAIPAVRPTTMDIPRAMPTRARLGRMLPMALDVKARWRADPENQRWYISATIAEGGGKNALCRHSAHPCQASAPAASTTQRQSQRVVAAATLL